MITQILNQMYELHENIKTSEDLIDFLQKAKPLYLKGLELCDALKKYPGTIRDYEIMIGDPLRERTLWSILDHDLNIADGLCEIRYKTKPHYKLDYWEETLKEAMTPDYVLYYKFNTGIYPRSYTAEVRNSFNLRIELIDKMLVIAKSKYNEH